ncbi:MAG: hypothetical protein RLZZ253_3103 [Verrucomicrobiota bacterium]|jgi:hypothetical protein
MPPPFETAIPGEEREFHLWALDRSAAGEGRFPVERGRAAEPVRIGGKKGFLLRPKHKELA